MDKEEIFIHRIQDLCRTAYDRGIVTFTDFLDLQEQNIIGSLPVRQWGVTAQSFGGYPLAERRVTAFIPDALCYKWEFPIAVLQIRPLDRKFKEMPNHRDFLGSLMQLGIERKMLGDILVEESSAWLFALDHMENFICQELSRVRHSPVEAVASLGLLPKMENHFEDVTGSLASIRLDSLISTAFQTSRSGLVDLIQGGKVFVNGKLTTSNSYPAKEGDIISVRGHGKFIYKGILSKTKKGRFLIHIQKYV